VFQAIEIRKTKAVFVFDDYFWNSCLFCKKSSRNGLWSGGRWYPPGLLPISLHNEASYFIGNKMARQYGFSGNAGHKNSAQNNHDRLKIASLLGVCPVIKKYEVDTGHWRGNIVDPFVEAMEYLVSSGLLDSYELLHDNRPISIEELRKLSIQDFRNVVVHFNMDSIFT
jgi:hypothetical protein